MNIHKNARQTPRGRAWMVRLAASGQKAKALAEAVGVCPRTVRKSVKRHAREARHQKMGASAPRAARPKKVTA